MVQCISMAAPLPHSQPQNDANRWPRQSQMKQRGKLFAIRTLFQLHLDHFESSIQVKHYNLVLTLTPNSKRVTQWLSDVAPQLSSSCVRRLKAQQNKSPNRPDSKHVIPSSKMPSVETCQWPIWSGQRVRQFTNAQSAKTQSDVNGLLLVKRWGMCIFCPFYFWSQTNQICLKSRSLWLPTPAINPDSKGDHADTLRV